jgi:chloramphenicol 3-O-phosphotransferase
MADNRTTLIGKISWLRWRYSDCAREAAKHEAGHALVSAVIGQPFVEVYIQDPKRHMGIGGGVVCVQNTTPARSIDAACVSMLKDITVHITGVLGEQNWSPVEIAWHRLERQPDRHVACGLMRAFALLHPDFPEIANDLFRAAWFDMAASSWRTAIAEASKVLLKSWGASVPEVRFRSIATKHGLTMPGVMGIIRPWIRSAENV